MSIIYDALKKVQKNNGSGKNPQEGNLQPVKTKAKLNPALIYLLVICLGLFLGNFAYIFFIRPKNTAAVQKAAPPAASQPGPIPAVISPPEATPTPLPAPNPEPTLVLNGVFFEQGDGYALINNKIMRLGDEIEKAKIKEITINGVELEFEGKTIKLASPS